MVFPRIVATDAVCLDYNESIYVNAPSIAAVTTSVVYYDMNMLTHILFHIFAYVNNLILLLFAVCLALVIDLS